MILCKTCAKQFFQDSPSPPSPTSSSLCVHGRRRGRRRNSTWKSIRKGKSVTNQIFEENSSKQTVEKDRADLANISVNFATSSVRYTTKSSTSPPSSSSVLCLDALKQLLHIEHEGDQLVLVQDENFNEVKSVVEAINHVVLNRKSLEGCVQAAVEKRKRVSILSKDPESNSKFVENQLTTSPPSSLSANRATDCKDDGVEKRSFCENVQLVNGQCVNSVNESCKPGDTFPCQFTEQTPANSLPIFPCNSAVIQPSSDVQWKPQPTPTDKTRKGVDAFTSDGGGGSLRGEPSFVASHRLKRLEEHFKGFVFTKKLLKDEPLVAVTDSDSSNNSIVNSCHLHDDEQQRTEQVVPFAEEAFRELDSSSPKQFHDSDYSPLVAEDTLIPRLHTVCFSPVPIDRCKRLIHTHENTTCTRSSAELIIDAEYYSASEQDARCLQEPDKCPPSLPIDSSLSKSSAGPGTFVIHSESDSPIDLKNVDRDRVHSRGTVDAKDEAGKKYLPLGQQTKNSLIDAKKTCAPGNPKQASSREELSEHQKDSQDDSVTTSRCVNKTAESQSHDNNSNSGPTRDDDKCTLGFQTPSDRYSLEKPPPPLPPRSPRGVRRNLFANPNPPPSAASYYYEGPLSVISLRDGSAVNVSAHNRIVFNNNRYNSSYSECVLGSVPLLPTPNNLPHATGSEVSCCEFDVRHLHALADCNLTFECYDELGIENCCESNYCYVTNEFFTTPCSASSSASSLSSASSSSSCGPSADPHSSVIETVPLFQHQHTRPDDESIHSNLHQYLHRCHVVPATQITMRELNGPLRGLLKKPNRPPPARKNRVVFDETRNEFFEADYIILIREDCAYDDEDEEPCTCGEHELVRLCCEEGCQCNYSEENVTPQSPKYAPPVEFVDEAALSPPDGYKDNGLNALQGALSGHVFGAQHIQQLQVIQRLQQQRAAMLAARASNHQQNQTTTNQQNQQQQNQQIQQQQQQQAQVVSSPGDEGPMPVCTECAECVECAAKQLQDEECVAVQCQEEIAQLSVPHVALLPIHNNSPERRITQKEIIAGEERPKYVPTPQQKEPEVTERRIVRESTEDVTTIKTGTSTATPAPLPAEHVNNASDRKPPIPAKPENLTSQISGILKGGKLWKNEIQAEEPHPTSDDDTNSKRSVRFITEGVQDGSKDGCDGQNQTNDKSGTEETINELIPVKKHSTLFHNVLRPNSAVRQLFPTGIHAGQTAPTALTSEALKAFEESKRGSLVSNLLTVGGSDTDTIRRTIERNALRRSLIKKKTMKPDMSLEERIKQLTCDIDEPGESGSDDQNSANMDAYTTDDLERRDSPAGEENPSQAKYISDKSFSPSSSASSSSSGSTSAYRKISDIFNRDRRQEKIPEAEENPIVIIPQECRCPAAPDLGMGVQVPAAHTQIHQTPPRQTEPRRQFLSTLAPLTACVAGQKDDFSYYTLAAADRNSMASAQCSDYSLGDIEAVLSKDESRKVAPDVIAGTPGQEQDELVIFAQQEAIRTDKIKKRYSNEQQNQVSASNVSSDDDEQNDYGFNKRPTVRGIKAKFETNEIIEEMQAQLSQQMSSQQLTSTKQLNALKPTNSIGPSITGKTPTQQAQTNNALSQNPADRAAWGYYNEEQRAELIQHPNYYQAIPAHFKQTFHAHEESLMYQNCQSVSMESHYGRLARSPSRRPESPPPLRNYHQTMVLIPYNTQSYAQFSTSNDQQSAGHQFRRQNVLEYQQVTQQTIRVPIGYTIPGMQLHLVAGRGSQQHQQQQQQQQQIQYTQNPRLVAPRTFNIAQQSLDTNSMKFGERGVPEGSASITHGDCKNVLSPTSAQAAAQNQNNQTSQVSPAVPGAVFYAMNV